MSDEDQLLIANEVQIQRLLDNLTGDSHSYHHSHDRARIRDALLVLKDEVETCPETIHALRTIQEGIDRGLQKTLGSQASVSSKSGGSCSHRFSIFQSAIETLRSKSTQSVRLEHALEWLRKVVLKSISVPPLDVDCRLATKPAYKNNLTGDIVTTDSGADASYVHLARLWRGRVEEALRQVFGFFKCKRHGDRILSTFQENHSDHDSTDTLLEKQKKQGDICDSIHSLEHILQDEDVTTQDLLRLECRLKYSIEEQRTVVASADRLRRHAMAYGRFHSTDVAARNSVKAVEGALYIVTRYLAFCSWCPTTKKFENLGFSRDSALRTLLDKGLLLTDEEVSDLRVWTKIWLDEETEDSGKSPNKLTSRSSRLRSSHSTRRSGSGSASNSRSQDLMDLIVESHETVYGKDNEMYGMFRNLVQMPFYEIDSSGMWDGIGDLFAEAGSQLLRFGRRGEYLFSPKRRTTVDMQQGQQTSGLHESIGSGASLSPAKKKTQDPVAEILSSLKSDVHSDMFASLLPSEMEMNQRGSSIDNKARVVRTKQYVYMKLCQLSGALAGAHAVDKETTKPTQAEAPKELRSIVDALNDIATFLHKIQKGQPLTRHGRRSVDMFSFISEFEALFPIEADHLKSVLTSACHSDNTESFDGEEGTSAARNATLLRHPDIALLTAHEFSPKKLLSDRRPMFNPDVVRKDPWSSPQFLTLFQRTESGSAIALIWCRHMGRFDIVSASDLRDRQFASEAPPFKKLLRQSLIWRKTDRKFLKKEIQALAAESNDRLALLLEEAEHALHMEEKEKAAIEAARDSLTEDVADSGKSSLAAYVGRRPTKRRSKHRRAGELRPSGMMLDQAFAGSTEASKMRNGDSSYSTVYEMLSNFQIKHADDSEKPWSSYIPEPGATTRSAISEFIRRRERTTAMGPHPTTSDKKPADETDKTDLSDKNNEKMLSLFGKLARRERFTTDQQATQATREWESTFADMITKEWRGVKLMMETSKTSVKYITDHWDHHTHGKLGKALRELFLDETVFDDATDHAFFERLKSNLGNLFNLVTRSRAGEAFGANKLVYLKGKARNKSNNSVDMRDGRDHLGVALSFSRNSTAAGPVILRIQKIVRDQNIATVEVLRHYNMARVDKLNLPIDAICHVDAEAEFGCRPELHFKEVLADTELIRHVHLRDVVVHSSDPSYHAYSTLQDVVRAGFRLRLLPSPGNKSHSSHEAGDQNIIRVKPEPPPGASNLQLHPETQVALANLANDLGQAEKAGTVLISRNLCLPAFFPDDEESRSDIAFGRLLAELLLDGSARVGTNSRVWHKNIVLADRWDSAAVTLHNYETLFQNCGSGTKNGFMCTQIRIGDEVDDGTGDTICTVAVISDMEVVCEVELPIYALVPEAPRLDGTGDAADAPQLQNTLASMVNRVVLRKESQQDRAVQGAVLSVLSDRKMTLAEVDIEAGLCYVQPQVPHDHKPQQPHAVPIDFILPALPIFYVNSTPNTGSVVEVRKESDDGVYETLLATVGEVASAEEGTVEVIYEGSGTREGVSLQDVKVVRQMVLEPGDFVQLRDVLCPSRYSLTSVRLNIDLASGYELVCVGINYFDHDEPMAHIQTVWSGLRIDHCEFPVVGLASLGAGRTSSDGKHTGSLQELYLGGATVHPDLHCPLCHRKDKALSGLLEAAEQNYRLRLIQSSCAESAWVAAVSRDGKFIEKSFHVPINTVQPFDRHHLSRSGSHGEDDNLEPGRKILLHDACCWYRDSSPSVARAIAVIRRGDSLVVSHSDRTGFYIGLRVVLESQTTPPSQALGCEETVTLPRTFVSHQQQASHHTMQKHVGCRVHLKDIIFPRGYDADMQAIREGLSHSQQMILLAHDSSNGMVRLGLYKNAEQYNEMQMPSVFVDLSRISAYTGEPSMREVDHVFRTCTALRLPSLGQEVALVRLDSQFDLSASRLVAGIDSGSITKLTLSQVGARHALVFISRNAAGGAAETESVWLPTDCVLAYKDTPGPRESSSKKLLSLASRLSASSKEVLLRDLAVPVRNKSYTDLHSYVKKGHLLKSLESDDGDRSGAEVAVIDDSGNLVDIVQITADALVPSNASANFDHNQEVEPRQVVVPADEEEDFSRFYFSWLHGDSCVMRRNLTSARGHSSAAVEILRAGQLISTLTVPLSNLSPVSGKDCRTITDAKRKLGNSATEQPQSQCSLKVDEEVFLADNNLASFDIEAHRLEQRLHKVGDPSVNKISLIVTKTEASVVEICLTAVTSEGSQSDLFILPHTIVMPKKHRPGTEPLPGCEVLLRNVHELHAEVGFSAELRRLWNDAHSGYSLHLQKYDDTGAQGLVLVKSTPSSRGGSGHASQLAEAYKVHVPLHLLERREPERCPLEAGECVGLRDIVLPSDWSHAVAEARTALQPGASACLCCLYIQTIDDTWRSLSGQVTKVATLHLQVPAVPKSSSIAKLALPVHALEPMQPESYRLRVSRSIGVASADGWRQVSAAIASTDATKLDVYRQSSVSGIPVEPGCETTLNYEDDEKPAEAPEGLLTGRLLGGQKLEVAYVDKGLSESALARIGQKKQARRSQDHAASACANLDIAWRIPKHLLRQTRSCAGHFEGGSAANFGILQNVLLRGETGLSRKIDEFHPLARHRVRATDGTALELLPLNERWSLRQNLANARNAATIVTQGTLPHVKESMRKLQQLQNADPSTTYVAAQVKAHSDSLRITPHKGSTPLPGDLLVPASLLQAARSSSGTADLIDGGDSAGRTAHKAVLPKTRRAQNFLTASGRLGAEQTQPAYQQLSLWSRFGKKDGHIRSLITEEGCTIHRQASGTAPNRSDAATILCDQDGENIRKTVLDRISGEVTQAAVCQYVSDEPSILHAPNLWENLESGVSRHSHSFAVSLRDTILDLRCGKLAKDITKLARQNVQFRADAIGISQNGQRLVSCTSAQSTQNDQSNNSKQHHFVLPIECLAADLESTESLKHRDMILSNDRLVPDVWVKARRKLFANQKASSQVKNGAQSHILVKNAASVKGLLSAKKVTPRNRLKVVLNDIVLPQKYVTGLQRGGLGHRTAASFASNDSNAVPIAEVSSEHLMRWDAFEPASILHQAASASGRTHESQFVPQVLADRDPGQAQPSQPTATLAQPSQPTPTRRIDAVGDRISATLDEEAQGDERGSRLFATIPELQLPEKNNAQKKWDLLQSNFSSVGSSMGSAGSQSASGQNASGKANFLLRLVEKARTQALQPDRKTQISDASGNKNDTGVTSTSKSGDPGSDASRASLHDMISKLKSDIRPESIVRSPEKLQNMMDHQADDMDFKVDDEEFDMFNAFEVLSSEHSSDSYMGSRTSASALFAPGRKSTAANFDRGASRNVSLADINERDERPENSALAFDFTAFRH